jgi:hypothetical protein
MLGCLTLGQSRAFIPSGSLQDFNVAVCFQFKDGMVVTITCTAVPKDVWSEYG